MTFGSHIRARRERLRCDDPTFSVRQVAQRIGVEPAYLSKIERDQVAPPSEATIARLAAELGEDADMLLALAGKVSDELRQIIMRRPQLFAQLLGNSRRCRTTPSPISCAKCAMAIGEPPQRNQNPGEAMISLENETLTLRFPKVHARATCEISFQRTLRIPDDNREYPLPPGLGRFPLRHYMP